MKGGYAPCRAAGLSHRACVAADSDFLLCRREGIAASDCGRATPAYSICRADGQSPHFCLAASNGYGACRQLGFPPSYCLSAGDGFKDCTIRHSGRSAAAVNWLALLTTGLNAPPDSSPPSPTPPAAPVTPAQPEKVIDWADPESRTHYLILAEKRSYVHAFLACDNRGWSLFNPDALDSREWDRFVKSPVYQAMPWTVRFAGDPGEIREAAYWTSRNYSDSTGASADAVTLRLRKVDGKIETRHGEYVSAVDGPLFTTFCMFRGKTWFRCSADQKCTTYTFTTTPGEPSYEIPEITDTTRIEDSGETEDAAWQLLLKIGQAHKAAGGLGAPYDCTMDQASVSCTQEH